MRPTLRQLEYAVAVADHQHFGRAAHACKVSQPGLSAQIRELEEILGGRLFERGRQGVVLTQLGREVVVRAREILLRTEELVQAAHSGRGPLRGDVRLGIIPTLAPYLLPKVLPETRVRYPALRLLLREDKTASLSGFLLSDDLDVLVVTLPLGHPELTGIPLFEEPLLLVTPRDHACARRNRPVRTQELEGETVLLLEKGHCLRDQALELCQQAGALQRPGLQATSLGTLVQMVAGGLGVTLIPEIAVPYEVREDSGVCAIPLSTPSFERTLGLAWRRDSDRGEEYALLGRVILDALSRHPGPS
jgi:LysR family transcriptional regulator, hydrogen peroxide-inducible genes activator